ncbi:MAG: RIP metalloprotease RseP [Vicinamibacterales bacterium]
MTTLLAFIFVLGVLVFVHELGHFLAAKRIGIKVLKFQLGFNPTILSVKRGDTEYSIGALPLGGYVKMAGENPDEAHAAPDEFLSRTKWERFQVLFMGPAMNLALAFILMTVVLYQGAQVPVFLDQPVVVGAIAPGSPAAGADIRPGDRIVSAADKTIDTWEQFDIAIATRPNRPVPLGIVRDGATLTVTVTPVPAKDSRFEVGEVGILPDVHPIVPAVNPGEPGDRGGIKGGDVIVAVDGQRIAFRTQLREAIASHPGQELTLSILRDGQPMELTVTPEKRGETGWLGIQLADASKSVKPGLVEAMRMSAERNVQYAGLIFETVWGLITRETSPKQLMGPVAIAQLSGESAQIGWIALFSLMASISLNLGLLNLLPIPVLDGGHILIMALEGVARRDFSMKVKEKMLLAGFVVLMMLMATVIYNDLTRIPLIERLMPWR